MTMTVGEARRALRDAEIAAELAEPKNLAAIEKFGRCARERGHSDFEPWVLGIILGSVGGFLFGVLVAMHYGLH